MKDQSPASVIELRASTASDAVFWESRESLTRIRDYARMSYVGPWALLGGVMLRAVADIPPAVTIPAIIGGRASMNLFVGFVGRSGHGKGASDAAARYYWPSPVVELPIGTGEGLAATFYRDMRDPESAANVPEAAIFSAAEVDTLSILGGRTGATLLPELRKLAMGETLGAQNASVEYRRIVPAHTYRACLSVGIQPERAGLLIGDSHGGTPQRFVWLSVADPGKPHITPADVEPIAVDRDALPKHGDIALPGVVYREVRQHRDRVLREDPAVDPLDGHRNLTKIKIASALALVDGRADVSESDWELSEYVMGTSDRTRDKIAVAIEQERKRTTADGARFTALRSILTGDEEVRLVAEKVLGRVSSEPIASAELRRRITPRLRKHFDPALELLCDAGQIQVAELHSGRHVRRVPG